MTKRHCLLDIEDWLNDHVIGYPPGMIRTLLAMVLAERSVMIIGRHGLGKNTICKLLAESLGLGDRWVYYDASKEDLVSVAGLPNPQAMAEGKLEFARHSRTIWNKEFVGIDEITRANGENQNLWLEILQEKTLFGEPLPLRAVIATCNPSSYAAAWQLDEAVFDRFAVILELPDFQQSSAAIFRRIVQVNLDLELADGDVKAGSPPVACNVEELRRELAETRRALGRDVKLASTIMDWVVQVTSLLRAPGTDRYMSPRAVVHLAQVFRDLISYETLALGSRTHADIHRLSACAARFCIGSRCKIDDGSLDTALRDAKSQLRSWFDMPPDPVAPLSTGSLGDRASALVELCAVELNPHDHQRVEIFARKLVYELLNSDEENVKLAHDLWWSLDRFPNVQRDMENAILAQKLTTLFQAMERVPRQRAQTRVRRATAGRAFVEDGDSWHPATFVDFASMQR